MRDKRAMIEPMHPQLSIVCQCDLLGLPRSSYYRETNAQTPDTATLELMRLIDEIYLEQPFFGTRQMRNYLRREHGYLKLL